MRKPGVRDSERRHPLHPGGPARVVQSSKLCIVGSSRRGQAPQGRDHRVKTSSSLSNWLITVVTLVLIVLVVGVIVVLVTQTSLFAGPTPLPPTAPPVLVTRVVPGTDLTPRVYPTLPPAWTDTPVPSTTPTVPTLTPSATQTPTITPTRRPTNTAAPTATGPTPTRRPTETPSLTPSRTPTGTTPGRTPSPTVSGTPS